MRFVVLTLAVSACSGHRLPPGTPPPEYEEASVPAWSEEASRMADAATSAPGSASPLAPELAPEPGRELSVDAGVR